MKRVLYYLAAAVFLSGAARADFQAGLAAYRQGDYATALREWQPVAEQGDANAQYNMGLLCALGQGVPQDFKRAAEWYEKAARQGVAAAQYNLGVIYANGQGVPQNVTEAREWFTKAAEQGVAQAEDSLGYFYGSGQGIPKNFAEAEKWYRRAAEKGIASAQFNLGVMYDLGQGVERDYGEALKWYRKAAAQGYGSAMTNIGILYYNGEGVGRDLVESYAWFRRAEKAGDSRAGQLGRIVASRIPPRDLERARELAANWKPEPPRAVEDEEGLFLRPAIATQAAGADRSVPSAGAPAPLPQPKPRVIRNEWTGVERTVAVGDVHGDFEQFVLVLESAGLVDGEGNWAGGRTHLVQTGDVLDRGPDSRKVMDLLMKLEKQAEAAGGRVHVLIGNHEAMNVYGDLRFVSPGEFAAFSDQAARRFSYEQARQGEAKPVLDSARWDPGQSPGMAEHRAALSPQGPYGKWITGHNAVVKIDDTLYVHAGISPKYAGWTLDALNEKVREELRNPQQLHGGIVIDEQGPLWYRGLAEGDEAAMGPLVDRLMRNFGVSRIVVGHTYTGGAVTPRFGGRVLMVDAGISRAYDNTGKVAALLVEDGKVWALHRGQKLELPKDEGPDLLRYLKEAAALDPKPSPLEARIAELESRLNSAAVK